MYNNYVPQPLAFYERLEYQTHRRHYCPDAQNAFRLILKSYEDMDEPPCTVVYLPPFQIKRPHSTAEVETLIIKRLDTGAVVGEIESPAIAIQELDPDNPDMYDALVYGGAWVTFCPATSADEFYLEITDGTNTWYSEVFLLDKSDGHEIYSFPAANCEGAGYLKLNWTTDCNLGNTIYYEFPGFQVFLPIDLGRPTYRYTEDKEEGGVGDERTTFQSIAKEWRFFIVGPEYLADALSFAQIFNNITLTFPNSDFVICEDFKVEVEWESDCLARIEVTFITNRMYRTACCQPAE